MNIERISIPETKNQLADIPKSKEIYSGDINDAVITVQRVTGYDITPDWWAKYVGNDGSTDEILERFDTAFEKFVREQITGVAMDEQEIGPTENEQQVLREANEEYDKLNEQFKDDPEYDKLGQEFLEALYAHLMSKYFPDEAIHDNEKELAFGVGIEISEEYDDEERQQLTDTAKEALVKVDEYLDGKTEDIFSGLTIRIGENVTKGGGEAISDKNMIKLNGRPMLMSLSEMRHKVPDYGHEELRGSTIDEDEVGGALRYTLVHEMGHILDELTETGDKRHRVASSESPTIYGREPDQYNSEKDHEAFAEGFAHVVYGMPVSGALAEAIQETVRLKLAEIQKVANS